MTRSGLFGPPASERLFAVGVSHRTVPLALLERLALPGTGGARILGELASHDAIHEAVLLSTCNRTELYLVATNSFEAKCIAVATLSREAGIAPGALRLQQLWGVEAARHLFLVTAGLESMVVGETEIQGQVRRAYKLALLEGVTGPITNRLFRGALEAGKRVRGDTRPRRSPQSVASVAVELAARTLGELEGRRALVIGTGENAELTGRALAEHRVQMVFVANRRLKRALTLARRFAARTVAFERLSEELVHADLAFSCTSSPGQIATLDDIALVMEQRHGRPLLLIDTGVPRNIDPAVRDLPRVALYDIDRLKRDVAGDLTIPAAETDRAGRVIDREVARFTVWLASRDVVPVISTVREHAETTVQRVLEDQEPLLESPSPHDRERVRMIAHAVVNRLLHEPTTRLTRSPRNGASRSHAQALLELFGPEPTASTVYEAPRRLAPRQPKSHSSDDARHAANS